MPIAVMDMDSEKLISQLAAIVVSEEELPEIPSFSVFAAMLLTLMTLTGILVNILSSEPANLVQVRANNSLITLAFSVVVGLCVFLTISIFLYWAFTKHMSKKRLAIRDNSVRAALLIAVAWRDTGTNPLFPCKIESIGKAVFLKLTDDKIHRIRFLLATCNVVPTSVPSLTWNDSGQITQG